MSFFGMSKVIIPIGNSMARKVSVKNRFLRFDNV